MKILVLGASGMAGHTIGLYFKEQGHIVHGLSTEPVDFLDRFYICDATDKYLLSAILSQGSFDCVINCIGILDQVAEKKKGLAIYLNGYLPHFIAEQLIHTNTKLVHLSTDSVFSGDKGIYIENSETDGKSHYDRTKALGEIIDDKNLTLRNSIIGPDMKEQGIGMFNWFMKQTGNIEGLQRAKWTGVTTLTLAEAIEQAIKQNLTGLYNLVNNEFISKVNLLRLLNKHMKNDELEITASFAPAPDKSLINTRNDFDFEVPSYEDMILKMKEWIQKHKSFYPHYFCEA
jgi:dTDP-4-dehydrorhamnose reductase